jgi:hypothetical protein
MGSLRQGVFTQPRPKAEICCGAAFFLDSGGRPDLSRTRHLNALGRQPSYTREQLAMGDDHARERRPTSRTSQRQTGVTRQTISRIKEALKGKASDEMGIGGLRTHRAAVYPGAHEFTQSLLRTGNGVAPGPRMPAPGDEVIFGQVLVQ